MQKSKGISLQKMSYTLSPYMPPRCKFGDISNKYYSDIVVKEKSMWIQYYFLFRP